MTQAPTKTTAATTTTAVASTTTAATTKTAVASTVPVATSPDEPAPIAAVEDEADIEDEYGWKPSVDPIYSVTVISDIVYGQGEVEGGGTLDDLLLDLYVPDVEGQDRFPLVVTIHGGGFNGGTKANTAFVSDQFAQRGYIVASINYRLSGDDPVPSSRVQSGYEEIGGRAATAVQRAAVAAMDDTMAALDFLHARPDVEPLQTVLWGNSAGAITAVYVGYAMDDFGIERPFVAAVISNSGGFIGEAGSAEMFIEEDYGVIDDPPYSYSEGPIFMTHATGDPVVPYQLSQDIADRAEAIGHPYERFSADAVSHGVPDGLFRTEFSPGVSVFQAQVNWLDGLLVGIAETP
tara:strand:+ start:41 stop:1087 length:1047 start_codon:yes stop_codon:yes gene_type:complete